MLYAKVNPQAREMICTEMKTTKDAKMYRRLKVIDLSGQGYNMAPLAHLFDLSEAAVRSYIHRFNRLGIERLHPHLRALNRPLAGKLQPVLVLLVEVRPAVHSGGADLLSGSRVGCVPPGNSQEIAPAEIMLWQARS